MGGNIPGGNFLGCNFPGGNFPGGSLMVGDFSGGIFPDTYYIIASLRQFSKTLNQFFDLSRANENLEICMPV